MRILVVDTYYPPFLAAHYAAHEGLESWPYAEQLSSLIGRHFGTADAYSRGFRALGEQAADAIANCDPLQHQWARETGRVRALRAARSVTPGAIGAIAEKRLRRQVLKAQIADYDPEVVYFQDLWVLSPGEIRGLREEGRLVVGQIASTPPPAEVLESFDLLISSFPHFVRRFREMGVESELLRIGFDDRVLELLKAEGFDPSPEAERPYPTSIVTSLDSRSHGRRVPLLERLSCSLEIGIWGYAADRLPPGSPILDHYNGEAWGLDMYRILAQTKIVVNAHEDVGEGYANNMRLFEATGVGALLITEGYGNLGEIFEPGVEVVTYDGADDLIEKVGHYLEHEDERNRIAAAGQARTISEHTYRRRIEQLLLWIRERAGA